MSLPLSATLARDLRRVSRELARVNTKRDELTETRRLLFEQARTEGASLTEVAKVCGIRRESVSLGASRVRSRGR